MQSGSLSGLNRGDSQTSATAEGASWGGPGPVLSRDKLSVSVAALLISASLASWVAVFYSMPAMTMASGGMMGVAALVSSPCLRPSACSGSCGWWVWRP